VTILTCPACGAPALTADIRGFLECPYCGGRLAGEPVSCLACGQVNLPRAEVCSQCGEPLTLTAQVMSRRGGQGSPPWLTRARIQAVGLQSTGEQASQVRMQSLIEVDRVREEALRKASAERATQDRQVMRILALGLAGLLIVVGLITLIAILL
jgi:predicted amidophosphoribosyltransferase